MSGPVVTDANLNFLKLKSNSFLDTSIALNNNIPYGAPNLNADSNYWGSLSSQHVDSVIYDYFDDATKSVVYYLPILTVGAPMDTCSISTSLDQIIYSEHVIFIYPNPTHSTFTIQLTVDRGQLTIYDVTGREVYSQPINSQLSTVDAQLSPGLYFVRVSAADRVWTEKVVVE